MSGLMHLRAAILSALRADAALLARVNSVEDGGTGKFSAPALVLTDMSASEWGARGVAGLAVRVPFTLHSRSDQPDGLVEAAIRIDTVMQALPPLAGGWQVGAVRFDRTRLIQTADGHRVMMIDYAVRLSLVG